jgi:formamidopyrimidine-DNA glycosylase
MPELPEVETVRRDIEPYLSGRTIRWARRVEAPPGPKYHGLERAAGQQVTAVTRRGKFLVMPLGSGDELIVHLGMTGALLRKKPADHLRVEIRLEGGSRRQRGEALFFRDPRRFGRCLVLRPGERGLLPSLAAMGPEPLEASFTPALLLAGLRRSEAAVKAVLLSQRAVAGVGNIYADEALFRAGIHPEAPAASLSARRVARLHQAIRHVLAAGLEDGGTTFSDYRRVDGSFGAHAVELAVYGRAGEPCVGCGRPLDRVVIGQRSTTFCARCQRR